MNIFVVGHRGRLGSELVRQGCTPLICDVTKPDTINDAVKSSGVIDMDVVVNCAAYTSVDGCEDVEGMKKAVAVNVRGIENLRAVLYRRWRLFHLSTDYVFDGRRGPYAESNRGFDPVNAYGCTKLGGEVALGTAQNKGDCIIRTTGLYGAKGHSDFASYILDCFKDNVPCRITDDLWGNHTYVPHLAKAIIVLASLKEIPAILHIASAEVITRCSFACMLAREFGYESRKLVMPVRNKDISGWIAKRPTKGGLKVDLAQKLGLPIFSILDGIKEYRNEI